MFTEKTYFQLKIFFRLASGFACLPIELDEKSWKFHSTSPRAKLWYFFMLSVLGSRACYHLAWIVHSVFNGFPPVADASIEIFYVIGSSLALFLHIGACLYTDELTDHLGQLLSANRRLKLDHLAGDAKAGGRHTTTGRKYSDGCTLFMRLMTPCMYTTPVSFGVVFLLQPHKRLYFYYFIPGEKPFWYKILYFIWEINTYAWSTPIIYLFWYVILLYGNSCNFWLKEISNAESTKGWSKYLLYNKKAALRIYRILHILTIQFNQGFGDLILPIANIFIIALHTLGLFLCIKFHVEIPIIFLAGFASAAVTCNVFEILIYPLLANVYEKSATFLKTSDGKTNKEWRRAKRAFPRLSVNIGGYYMVERESALTFVSFVATTTANLLVSM